MGKIFGNGKGKALGDAIIFGAGLTVGFILISGGIKMVDKLTGGSIIPDEFAQAKYGAETMNSLDIDAY